MFSCPFLVFIVNYLLLVYLLEIKSNLFYLHSNAMQEQTSVKMLCKSSSLIKLDKSKMFNLQANCLTVQQHTISLLKKFHTLITLNEKLYFLQSNLNLFFTNLNA